MKRSIKTLLLYVLSLTMLLTACSNPGANTDTAADTETEVMDMDAAGAENGAADTEDATTADTTQEVLPAEDSETIHYGKTKLVLSGQDSSALDQLEFYPDLTELDLSGMKLHNIAPLLNLENLEILDLRRTGIVKEQIDLLAKVYPNAEIKWNVPIDGTYYDNTVTKLILDDITDVDMLAYFPHLESVDLTKNLKTLDEMDALEELYPDLTFYFSFNLAEIGHEKIELNGYMQEVDLTRKRLDGADLDTVIRCFKHIPDMTRLVLCECRIPDENMEIIRDAFPDVKVVWTLYIGYHKCNTDVLAWSTLSYDKEPFPVSSADVEKLKYCTDLIALDLGHQAVTDLSFLYNFPHLRVLILSDNRVSDITPIASLTELRYLEMFMNFNTHSFEPLTHLEHLRDLNVCYVKAATDFEELYKLRDLKRLWMMGCSFSVDEREALVAQLPEGCKFEYRDSWEGSTGAGWRVDPTYDSIFATFSAGGPLGGAYVAPEFLDDLDPEILAKVKPEP